MLAGVLALAAVSAQAQTFTTTLSGTRETGGGDLAGRGLAAITISGTNLYYFLWVQNIASPVAAHVHTGLQGVSGGVLVGLDPTWTTVATGTYMATGSVAVDNATLQAILQNPAGYYVNVHNGPFPGGAMRGQLLGDGPATFALATTLRGSREPSGGSASGQGFAAIVFDTSSLYYYLWETGIAAPTAAHIHTGGAGANGAVLVGLSPTFGGGQAMGSVAVDAATLDAIQASPELYYVNIHNADFPGGAIRGQLAATETDANFAVAAHNAGLGTSFFRTDMRALNLTDEPATVYAEWYLHGLTNATGPTGKVQFVIGANGEAFYDDVVSSLFATSNRGAIRLLSAFPFKALARNYNDQRPSGSGTFGQDEPGLGTEGALTAGALIFDSNRPKGDSLGFRTNLGYFNPSPYPVDVTFNVRTPDGALVGAPSKVTLPAWGNDQALYYQLIPGIPTAQQTLENFFVTFTATKPVYLFSSPVDNKTDDGMHLAAFKVPAALTAPVGATQAASPTGTITTPAGNTSVPQGTAVSFEGTGTDPRGEALTVHWDFGDGASGTGYTTAHAFASTGVFTVKMVVSNTDGVSDPNPPTRTITVNPTQQSGPPVGTITTPAGDTSAFTGYVVSFAGRGTDPKGETLTATWDFGDGSTATGFTVSHTFMSAGAYTVKLTVTNTDAVSDPNPPTLQVSVTDYNYPY